MTAPLLPGPAEGYPDGHTAITREGEAGAEVDFGIWRMPAGAVVEESHRKESAWVLLSGRADLEWPDGRARVHRDSIFDEAPTTLHVPAGTRVRVASVTATEWAVARAANERPFAPRLFTPADVVPEYRGRGLAQGACLRNVRLVFDDGARPEANLVLGEVVNYPGRWSSYPPHFHDQPEIYHYRFTRPQGYGHAELGDEVMKVRQGDTLKIPGGRTHAQVAAPGYGMYYLWIVRHLAGKRYTGFTFEDEHRWVLDPSDQGWQPREGPRD